MNNSFDSVYPDFLKSGLGRLGELDTRRELVALFSALEHFRADLHQQNSGPGILAVTQRYVAGLNLFHSTGFWLVNPADMNFDLSIASPEGERMNLQKIIDVQIKSGRFALALRRSSPVFFDSEDPALPAKGLLHSLTLSTQAVGMFCGMLQREMSLAQDVAFSLLSLLLGGCADAFASLRKTTQLTTQLETLAGLLPVCAWCKKVRSDTGYWEQIDRYFSNHSKTHFTHGVCPECKIKFLAGMKLERPLGTVKHPARGS